MEKFKVTLSVIVGSIFMIMPLYQVVMFGLLLSEKINYTFISFCFGISLIAFWGRLKVLANKIQSKYQNK
jgi:putative Ca2+/H+ antiporter (TMEM165/GDT1 family)